MKGGGGEGEGEGKGSGKNGPPPCAATCKLTGEPTCADLDDFFAAEGCAADCPEDLKKEARSDFCKGGEGGEGSKGKGGEGEVEKDVSAALFQAC